MKKKKHKKGSKSERIVGSWHALCLQERRPRPQLGRLVDHGHHSRALHAHTRQLLQARHGHQPSGRRADQRQLRLRRCRRANNQGEHSASATATATATRRARVQVAQGSSHTCQHIPASAACT